jgi:hypothetical protein
VQEVGVDPNLIARPLARVATVRTNRTGPRPAVTTELAPDASVTAPAGVEAARNDVGHSHDAPGALPAKNEAKPEAPPPLYSMIPDGSGQGPEPALVQRAYAETPVDKVKARSKVFEKSV